MGKFFTWDKRRSGAKLGQHAPENNHDVPIKETGRRNASMLFRPAIKFHSDVILEFSGKGT